MINLFVDTETLEYSESKHGVNVSATHVNIYPTDQIKDDPGVRLEFTDSEHNGFELDLITEDMITLYEKLTPFILKLLKEED